MLKTLQTQVIRGLIVLILVIGTLSVPQIFKDEKKMAAPRSSGEAEQPPPSGARYSANPLPRGAFPASSESTATYTAPHNRLQVEERDPTLEEEGVSPSLAEQYAQEQYLQQVAAMEEILQREFDPTVAPLDLTVEQLAAVEEEIQESALKSRLRYWDESRKFPAVRTPGNCRRYRLSDIRRFQGLVEQEDGKTDAAVA